MAGRVASLRIKSPGVNQLVAEAYQNLGAPEMDGLAGRVTEVRRTGEPAVELGGKRRRLYKKGYHLRPGNWRPICCAVTEAKLVGMVVFVRIQHRLYAAGVLPDNMLESMLGRSAQQAGFLYDMHLDNEDLEAFMVSVDVKKAFRNTPHRLIEELWRQFELLYGHLVKKVHSRHGEGLYGVGDSRWRGAKVRSGGPIRVHACHAATNALDSTAVSTAGEDATHLAGTSIWG